MDSDSILSGGRKVLAAEAQAIQHLSQILDDNFVRAVQLILDCKGRVIVIGVGKSGHVGQKIAASLASLGTPAHFVHASEAVHGDLGMIQPGDVLVLISNSGETAELVHLLPHLEQHNCASIAITSRPQSTLARSATVHLDIGVTQEADTRNLAPTTSSTVTLALGDALAIALADLRGFTRDDFARYHPGGSLGKQLRAERNPQEEE